MTRPSAKQDFLRTRPWEKVQTSRHQLLLACLALRACLAAAGVGMAFGHEPKLFWTMPHSHWGPASLWLYPHRVGWGCPPSVGASEIFQVMPSDVLPDPLISRPRAVLQGDGEE